jgi:hypothetical protein
MNELIKLKNMSRQKLDPAIIKQGLKNLCKTASGEHYAFTEMDLSNRDITTIVGVEKY